MANLLRRLKNTHAVGAVEKAWEKVPRPQDIAGGLIQQSLYGGWTGARNAYRAVRGEAKAKDFMTGEKVMMTPRERLANDLRKKRKEFRAGYQIEFDPETGRHVPKMERDENGFMQPVKVGRREMAGKIVSDAVVGNAALLAGWGAKTATGAAAYAAVKSVRPMGHAAYQTYGLARDFGIAGAGMLKSMSENKVGAWALGLAPIGAMVAAEAYDTSEHYAINKGIRAYEGQQVDGVWGSITGGGRWDLEAAGRRERHGDVTRGSGQVMDTFGTGGDLVFSMHNQR